MAIYLCTKCHVCDVGYPSNGLNSVVHQDLSSSQVCMGAMSLRAIEFTCYRVYELSSLRAIEFTSYRVYELSSLRAIEFTCYRVYQRVYVLSIFFFFKKGPLKTSFAEGQPS